MKPLNILIPLFVLLTLYGCASRDYIGNAEKLYENQLYKDALQEINAGLQKDPHNAELKVAMRKTQAKIFERELIRIRDTRAAGDPLQALNQVREVKKKMREWNIDTNIDGSKFQKKEIESLFWDFKKYVDNYLVKNQVLKAYSLHQEYKDVLYFLSPYKDYEKTIMQKGKDKCLSLREAPFFNIFIVSYCNFFQQNHNVTVNLASYLFRETNSYLKADGKTYNINGYLNGSKLFHPQGQAINLSSFGKFSYKIESQKIRKSQGYTDRESYWTTVTDTKFRTEYYWTTEMKCNYMNKWNPCTQQRVRKSRIIPYYKKRKVKKWKNVNKTYYYTVTQKNQYIRLKSNSYMDFSSKKYDLNRVFKDSYSDYEHNETRHGLRPRRAYIKDSEQWKMGLIGSLKSDAKATLESIWEKEQCVIHENAPFMEQGDKVFACSLVAEKAFMNTWSEQFTGLSFKDIKSTLKLP